METYNGQVRTPTDAIILFEACRLGLLPRVQRRLSEKERQSIRSGSVFVWDEREAGMRRWTDGKSWSASRVSGSFLTYREMEGKRGPGNNYTTVPTASRGVKTPDSGRNSAEDPLDMEEGPDGYRYKPDGLMKQSFSITTNQNQHLHLISYYSRSHPAASNMRLPSTDPSLASIQIPKGMYPETTINDQSNTPAVTRSPMPGAPNYVMAPSPTYARQQPPPPPPYAYYPGFIHHPNGYMYPISPMHTPPGYALHPAYAHAAGVGPMGHPPSPYGHPPPPHMGHAPPSAYDQRPLRNSVPGSSGPPPPPSLQHSMSAPSGSLPPPPLSPRSQAMTSQYASQYPPAPSPYAPSHSTENIPAVSQIDPRLTEATSAQSESGIAAPAAGEEPNTDARSTETTSTTPGQIPTIGRLVNEARTTPMTPHPAASNTTSEKEAERQGSTSPGGTKHSVPPQDIPSEKLGFREDMRALSKLDRVFARV